MKRKIYFTRSERVGEQLRNVYLTKIKEVKKQLKKDKNDWAEVAKEAQKAAEQGLKQFIMLPGFLEIVSQEG